MRVFILLFNARTDNEGIHTIQIGDRQKILMFKSFDDATRYALMLEAQDLPSPTVEEMDSEEIEAFCQSNDYDWEIIEEGRLEIPPEKNVAETDWKPEELESQEPESQEPEPQEPEPQETESQMSNEELEKIRRRLEGLL
ncbi:MAG: DUF3110 domain-containing protein [Prochloraceae cyanobacterium]|nr:DUF3110 domain-containing protein [Prochloraceae cyanobacterium]